MSGPASASAPPTGTGLSAEELRRRLEAASSRRIELKITCNLRRFVSFRTDLLGRVKARVQEAFLKAPEPVLDALARWMGKGRGRCPPVVRGFINACARRIEPPDRPLRPVAIRTAGRAHDLAAIFERVNREFFGGAVTAPITWGRAARPGRRARFRRLGAYNRRRGLISINPALDRPEVPGFFVAFIVYHEMLHALQPGDCRRWHGREFHAAERRHPDYRRARAWERRNLEVLMSPLRERPRTGSRAARAPAAVRLPQPTLF